LSTEGLYQSVELMERYSIDLAIDLLADWMLLINLANGGPHASFVRRFHFSGVLLSLWVALERLVETDCIEARTDGANRFYRRRRAPWRPELRSCAHRA